MRTMMRTDTGTKQDVKGQEKVGHWRLAGSLLTIELFPKCLDDWLKKG